MESEMVFWDWTALGAFLKCIGGIQSKAISIDLVHIICIYQQTCPFIYVVIAAFHPILLKAVEEGHLGTYAPRKNWQNIRGAAGQSWIQSIEIQKGKLQERNQQTTEPTIMDLDPATMDPNDSQLVPIQISWDGMG